MKTRSIKSRGAQRSAATMALAFASALLAITLAGCQLFGPKAIYDTAEATIYIADISEGPSRSVMGPAASFVGGPSRAVSPTTSPEEISRVELSVAGEDRFGVYQDPLGTLTLTGSGASWSGSLPGLPLGPALTFTVTAFDSSDTLIYTGTTTTVLSALQLSVALILVPFDDAVSAVGFPVIRQITRPAEIVEGTDATVSVSLEGSGDETLSVELTSGGGAFTPAGLPGSPVDVPLSSGAANLDLTYSAPDDAPATYLHTVRAENEQGNSVSREFTTTVVWETADGTIAIGGVAPAATGFDLSLNVDGDLVIEATVTDDGPLGDISYNWRFKPHAKPPKGEVLPSFINPNANPGVLANYTETVTGQVILVVTDNDTSVVAGGLSTTVHFVLPAGLFPDDVISIPSPWSSPASIPLGGNPNAYEVHLEQLGPGQLLGVWHEYGVGGEELWAARFDGTSWTTPVQLSVPIAGYSYGLTVSSDGNGNALATWYQYDSAAPDYRLYYAQFNGGSWSVPAEIVTAADPSFRHEVVSAVADDGTQFIAWNDLASAGNSVKAIVDSGSGWSVPQELIAFDSDARSLSMDAAGAGFAVLAWVQQDPTTLTHHVLANVFTASGTWLQAASSANSNSPRGTECVVSEDGVARVIWSEPDTFGAQLHQLAYDPSSDWGADQTIHTSSVDIDARSLALTKLGATDTIVVWSETDGYSINTVHSMELDGSTGTWRPPELIRAKNSDTRVFDTRITENSGSGVGLIWWERNNKKGTAVDRVNDVVSAVRDTTGGFEPAVRLGTGTYAYGPDIAFLYPTTLIATWTEYDGTNDRMYWSTRDLY